MTVVWAGLQLKYMSFKKKPVCLVFDNRSQVLLHKVQPSKKEARLRGFFSTDPSLYINVG